MKQMLEIAIFNVIIQMNENKLIFSILWDLLCPVSQRVLQMPTSGASEWQIFLCTFM